MSEEVKSKREMSVTIHAESENATRMKLNGMKIKIDGTMNPCTFIGCSYEERAGFQTVNVSVKADFENATKEEVDSWMKETEARCPVTDNIKDSTKINVTNN